MDNKEKKQNCNGYESVFTFLNNEDFEKHLLECEDCKKEHEKMQKISELIQEAKPFLKSQKQKAKIIKSACALLMIVFTSLCVPALLNTGKIYEDIIAMNSPSIEEMGLPVDEYGFLLVE